MKSVFLSLLIFMLTTGFVIAENKEKVSKPVEGVKKGRVSKISGGKFSRMYIHLMHQTGTLDLSKAQRAQINKSSRPQLMPIFKEEKKSRNLQREFMSQLESNQFDPEKLKRITKNIQEANIKAADNFINAVSNLIIIIGPQYYAKLRPITRINRNVLVQLREGNVENLMEVGDKEQEPKANSKK